MSDDWIEADVTINGTQLTKAQSMTLRVALESFAMSLSHDGLGNDEHGEKMAAAYLARASEIRESMYRGQPGWPGSSGGNEQI